ncbi:hypothetical protein JCM14713_35430 [Desulfomicrobium salsuginis]
MSLTINHNLMAINTARNLSTHYGSLGVSTRRLSSGLRIGTAADDAAGLAVREIMRADIASLGQGIRNANDAISMIQVADGALQVIDEKLIRMKELATQAATGTYNADQRAIINDEFQAMKAEIERIAASTEFNGIKLLSINDNTNPLVQNPTLGSLFVNGVDLNSNLHFWGKFNGNADDSGSNGFPTNVVNATLTTDRFNNPDSAYLFNGIDSGIEVNNFSMDYSAITISAWVQQLSQGHNDQIVNGPFGFQLEVGDATGPGGYQSIMFDAFSSFPPDRLATSSDLVTFNEWHHIVGTNNGTTSRIYYDGNLVAERDVSGTLSFSSSRMDIGTGGFYESFWNGKIDDVRIYARGLNDEEIRALYTGIGDSLSASTEINIHFGKLNTENDSYHIKIYDASTIGMQINDVEISTQESAQKSLDKITEAIIYKDKIRASLGATQNRLENTITNLEIQAENLQAAESRISDADMATEMTEFVKSQILTQSATAMLAQANALPEMALQLIQG